MRGRALPVAVFVLIAGGIAALFWLRPPQEQPPVAGRPATRPAAAPAAAVATGPASSDPGSALVGESSLADDLDAPNGTIQRDLAILEEVFTAWQTNFPRQGNPVGENAEITAALAGGNALRFAFISPRHSAINAAGELCDRWGTPFRFHQLSGTRMEIRSAGPDRKFGGVDDATFTPP